MAAADEPPADTGAVKAPSHTPAASEDAIFPGGVVTAAEKVRRVKALAAAAAKETIFSVAGVEMTPRDVQAQQKAEAVVTATAKEAAAIKAEWAAADKVAADKAATEKRGSSSSGGSNEEAQLRSKVMELERSLKHVKVNKMEGELELAKTQIDAKEERGSSSGGSNEEQQLRSKLMEMERDLKRVKVNKMERELMLAKTQIDAQDKLVAAARATRHTK